MAVGYQNHAIYVGNGSANAKLGRGVYYSLDDGQSWQQSALNGIKGQLIQAAVDPLRANVVALGTEQGLFLSNDYGNTFTQVGDTAPVTALTFGPRGEELVFATQQLFRYDTRHADTDVLSGTITPFPPLPRPDANDTIIYLAINFARFDDIALATVSKNIYLSPNRGKTWVQIVVNGQLR